jgi:hypothetical protein
MPSFAGGQAVLAEGQGGFVVEVPGDVAFADRVEVALFRAVGVDPHDHSP